MIHRFEGLIAGGGFGGSHAVIVGLWRRSPLGRFVDVMWIDPAGRRTLFAPSAAIRDYVAALYAFDEAHVVALRGGWDGHAVAVAAGPLRVELVAGPRGVRSWLFASRPKPLRRNRAWITVEDRLARPLVGRLIGGGDGVRAAGTAPGGQREWYGVDDYRPLADGRLTVDGVGAGTLSRLPPRLGVGPSAFPRQPAIVAVGTLIEVVASQPRS